MVPCRKMLLVLLAATLLLFAGTSHAELNDQGRSVLDTDTGLEWLKMGETVGLSPFQIAILGERGLYAEGWVHATVEQIETLFVNAGIPQPFNGIQTPEGFAGANLLMSLLGPTGSFGGSVSIQAFSGPVPPPPPEPPPPGSAPTLFTPVVITSFDTVGGADSPGPPVPLDVQNPTIGNYLVRQAGTLSLSSFWLRSRYEEQSDRTFSTCYFSLDSPEDTVSSVKIFYRPDASSMWVELKDLDRSEITYYVNETWNVEYDPDGNWGYFRAPPPSRFHEVFYYWYKTEAEDLPLEAGEYKIEVSMVGGSSVITSDVFHFLGRWEPPLVKAKSIMAWRDKRGGLRIMWPVPYEFEFDPDDFVLQPGGIEGIPPNSARLSITLCEEDRSDENGPSEYVADVFIKLPTHLGRYYVPEYVIDELQSKVCYQDGKVGLNARIRDNFPGGQNESKSASRKVRLPRKWWCPN